MRSRDFLAIMGAAMFFVVIGACTGTASIDKSYLASCDAIGKAQIGGEWMNCSRIK